MSILHSIINYNLMASKRIYDPKNPMDYAAVRNKELQRVKGLKTPRAVKIEESMMEGVSVEWLTTPKNPKERIILYIHGGGFVVGSVKTRRAFTTYVANKLGYNVLAVEYRLAPEAPFPAAPKDCFYVYKALLDSFASKNIVILGESAGANLVLATLLQIKAEKLPQPAAAFCIAPCVQYDAVFPSYQNNAKKDAMVANLSEEVADMYLQSHDAQRMRNPLAAPYYGDFTDCAPIYLWASTAEVLLDDSVKFYEKMKKEKHPCTLYLRDGMMHTWMTIPYFSEAKRDLKQMQELLKDAFEGRFVQEMDVVRLK